MATEAGPFRRRIFPEQRRTPSVIIGIAVVAVLLVLLLIGYAGSLHVDVSTNEAATAQPVVGTAAARLGALAQVTPLVATQAVDRAVTVVPNTGFAVVTVTARDGVTVRSQPNTAATAAGQAPVGSDLMVTGTDVLDPGGTSRWIPVRYQGIEGFVRSDLVDEPHAA